jgi:hypothetical protein
MQDAARILHEEGTRTRLPPMLFTGRDSPLLRKGITPQKMSMMTMLTNKKVRDAVTRVSKAASASGVDQETFMVCRMSYEPRANADHSL